MLWWNFTLAQCDLKKYPQLFCMLAWPESIFPLLIEPIICFNNRANKLFLSGPWNLMRCKGKFTGAFGKFFFSSCLECALKSWYYLCSDVQVEGVILLVTHHPRRMRTELTCLWCQGNNVWVLDDVYEMLHQPIWKIGIHDVSFLSWVCAYF